MAKDDGGLTGVVADVGCGMMAGAGGAVYSVEEVTNEKASLKERGRVEDEEEEEEEEEMGTEEERVEIDEGAFDELDDGGTERMKLNALNCPSSVDNRQPDSLLFLCLLFHCVFSFVCTCLFVLFLLSICWYKSF